MLSEPKECLFSRIIRGRQSWQDPGGGEVLRTASLKLPPGFLCALRNGRVLPVEVLGFFVPTADDEAPFFATDLQVVLGVRQGVDGGGQSVAVVEQFGHPGPLDSARLGNSDLCVLQGAEGDEVSEFVQRKPPGFVVRHRDGSQRRAGLRTSSCLGPTFPGCCCAQTKAAIQVARRTSTMENVQGAVAQAQTGLALGRITGGAVDRPNVGGREMPGQLGWRPERWRGVCAHAATLAAPA